MPEADLSLVVRRTMQAPPARVFEAWTSPEHLRRWWGPRDVRCTSAEIDLRVGGAYRIANELPDGRTLWITGEFERIEPPHRLVYSWHVGPVVEGRISERVTVRFEARDGGTEVIIVHERIADPAARASHEGGWLGCLDGLVAYVDSGIAR